MTILLLFILAFAVVMIAAMWRIFEKAGEPGWACIIPIYSTIVLLKIVGKPWWWLLLMIIPYVGIIWGIWALNLLMKSFGKSEGWTVGAIFLPFIIFPMLAWGDAQYQGEVATEDHPDILDAGVR